MAYTVKEFVKLNLIDQPDRLQKEEAVEDEYYNQLAKLLQNNPTPLHPRFLRK